MTYKIEWTGRLKLHYTYAINKDVIRFVLYVAIGQFHADTALNSILSKFHFLMSAIRMCRFLHDNILNHC